MTGIVSHDCWQPGGSPPSKLTQHFLPAPKYQAPSPVSSQYQAASLVSSHSLVTPQYQMSPAMLEALFKPQKWPAVSSPSIKYEAGADCSSPPKAMDSNTPAHGAPVYLFNTAIDQVVRVIEAKVGLSDKRTDKKNGRKNQVR